MGSSEPPLGTGWAVLAAVLLAIGALNIVGTVWTFVDGWSWSAALWLPVQIVFVYWLVMGAWRRARRPATATST